jgi:hypothetical protein
MEELTAGQAAVLVRNEQDIDRSNEELEELEDTLNESIADSMRGARQRAAGAEPQKKKKRWGGAARSCASLLADYWGLANSCSLARRTCNV